MNKILEVLKNNKGILKKIAIGAAVLTGTAVFAEMMQKPEEIDQECYELEATAIDVQEAE